MLKLLNIFADEVPVTTADIVIIVCLVIVVLAIIGYFVWKKMNGKRISDCGCGTDGKGLVKKYFKKYPKNKDKDEEKHDHSCCCGK